jgi:hypothetical protein
MSRGNHTQGEDDGRDTNSTHRGLVRSLGVSFHLSYAPKLFPLLRERLSFASKTAAHRRASQTPRGNQRTRRRMEDDNELDVTDEDHGGDDSLVSRPVFLVVYLSCPGRVSLLLV